MKQVQEMNTQPIVKDQIKYKIRGIIETLYDLQDLRIRTGNRVYQAFRIKEAAVDASTGEVLDSATLLKKIVLEYEGIQARIANRGGSRLAQKDLKGTQFITNKTEYHIVSVYTDAINLENVQKSALENIVEEHPMWSRFFENVRGCGPALAGICIAYLDPHEARHVSSFWSYAGVGTLTDENGNRVAMCRKNLREVEYVDTDGNVKTKKTLGYNSKLHDKLLKVLCDSIIKSGGGSLDNAKSKYAKVYYDKKNYYANRYDGAEKSAMHIDKQARRCVVKEFLRDLWCEWRSYEGYTLSQPYEVEYLGRAPHEFNEAHYRKAI